MPPTLTTSLNPIDHPAFSPLDVGESVTRYTHTSTTTSSSNLATSLSHVPRIPNKFIAARQVIGVQTRTLNQATHPTALRYNTQPPKTPAPAGDLPELPKWALGILVGTLSFLLVLSVLLFLAQFPPRFQWLRAIKRRWLAGYTKLSQEDHELHQKVFSGSSSAVSPRLTQRGGLKHRRPRHLSIDTSVGAAYGALGIVVPEDKEDSVEEHRLPRNRYSFDAEALRITSGSPIAPSWQSLTAPLPAAPTFNAERNATEYEDIVARPYPLSVSTISTPDLVGFKSNLQRDDEEDYPGSALFQKVNEGIYHAADKLSKAFYEHVNEPEEGLLLPVHEGDREKALAPGVFVD